MADKYKGAWEFQEKEPIKLPEIKKCECGGIPEKRGYSGQYPFEITVQIRCPKCRKVVHETEWLPDLSLDKKVIEEWNQIADIPKSQD